MSHHEDTDITDDISKCKLTNGWNLILQLKARGQKENIISDVVITKEQASYTKYHEVIT